MSTALRDQHKDEHPAKKAPEGQPEMWQEIQVNVVLESG